MSGVGAHARRCSQLRGYPVVVVRVLKRLPVGQEPEKLQANKKINVYYT
jgi:hypothetical protein